MVSISIEKPTSFNYPTITGLANRVHGAADGVSDGLSVVENRAPKLVVRPGRISRPDAEAL
jgi:hypothetical protein